MTDITEEKPSAVNIMNVAAAVCVIGLASIVISQQNDLKSAVRALAIVSAKCSK